MAVARRRRLLISLLVLLASFMGLARQVEASDGMRGDRCIVEADQHITEDFYFFCRVLEVHGTIDGDLIGIASEITIEAGGEVAGDLWVGGGRLQVRGRVGDDVHFAGITASVQASAVFGHPRVDLAALALNAEIEPGAVVPGDLLFRGYQVKMRGTLGGDLDFGGESLRIEGVVLGRVDASVGDPRRSPDVPHLPIYDLSFENPGLWIGAEAQIAGDLLYKSAEESDIPPGAVEGLVVFDQTSTRRDITQARAEAFDDILWDYVKDTFRDFLTISLIGLVGLYFMPALVRRPAQNVRRQTISSVGWGLLTFMLSIPVVIVVLVIGLILVGLLYLVKLGGLTLMVGVAVLVITGVLVGGFSFLIFFMGRIIASYVIGQYIYRYAFGTTTHMSELRRWLTTLVMGTAIYALITNMPVPALGLIIELITALAGIGAVVMYAREMINTSTLLTITPQLAAPPPSAALSLPPPPELEETAPSPPPPGMDNLPEGFTGFDEDW